jgi:hypothetical protein
LPEEENETIKQEDEILHQENQPIVEKDVITISQDDEEVEVLVDVKEDVRSIGENEDIEKIHNHLCHDADDHEETMNDDRQQQQQQQRQAQEELHLFCSKTFRFDETVLCYETIYPVYINNTNQFQNVDDPNIIDNMKPSAKEGQYYYYEIHNIITDDIKKACWYS